MNVIDRENDYWQNNPDERDCGTSASPRRNIDALYQQLADSIADVIAHPDCPPPLYRSLTQWMAEFASDLEPATGPEDEAAHVRAELPQLCRIAARKREGQEVR